jgi:hypothetical protein
MEIPQNVTWEECDAHFERICLRLKNRDRNELLGKPLITDANLVSMGAVLIELISAAYWSDGLLFFQTVCLLFPNLVEKHSNKA